jgi:hypothetical protein
MGVSEISLVVVAVAIFGAIDPARVLSDKPLSFPLLLTVFGFLLFSLAPGVEFPDLVVHASVIECVTALLVITALMGCGADTRTPLRVAILDAVNGISWEG